MTWGCSFSVPGFPVPQGSHSVRRGRVVQQNREQHMRWRWAVTAAAREAWGSAAPLAGPVGLELTFYRPRPASHWTGRGELSAEGRRHPWPGTPPDLDKLIRSVGDSLTGTVYRDDAQVVHLLARKQWRQEPGCVVTVYLYGEGGR